MSPAFSRGIQEIHQGKILAPILRAELTKPRWRPFNLKIAKWTPRPPDGWFHPSTHSSWPARKLLLYLRHPEMIEEEEPSLEKVFAVTQGHFFHEFAGRILKQNGVMKETEIPLQDPECNRKGHVDGELSDGDAWEFKTMNNDWLLKNVNSPEELREKKPGYFSQSQDYMDMMNVEKQRYLIMGMFFPYPMNEFIVYRDQKFIDAQRRKYTEVLERFHERTPELPERCCAPRSSQARECDVATACPVGRAALGAA